MKPLSIAFLLSVQCKMLPNDVDVPSEANLCAKPQCYMEWLQFIQKEMEQKKFIQEMKSQDKASSSYVHKKLQECESCVTVCNRDVNSALNIYGIFVYKSKHANESPPPLQKTFK